MRLHCTQMEMSSYLAPHTPDGALEGPCFKENVTLWAKSGRKTSLLPTGWESLEVPLLAEQQLWGEAEALLVAQEEPLPTRPSVQQGSVAGTHKTQ